MDDLGAGDIDTVQEEQAQTKKLTNPHPHVKAVEVDHVDAMKQYDRAWQKERENIEMAYADLAFAAGEQWYEELREQRESDSRPVMTFNRMGQFIRQVTGDMRQTHPSIKVVATDDGQNEKIAEIRGGLIRYIENRSDAEDIYNRASDSQVTCGVGHVEIAGEYADDSTFEQEIIIRALDDQVAVLWDPDARHPTRKDAMFCFVPTDMTREAYKETYPDHAINDMGTWDGVAQNWYGEDKIRVCRYWYKVKVKRDLMRMPSGNVEDLTGLDEEKIFQLLMEGGVVYQRDGYKIFWRMMNGTEYMTEPQEWAGRYIPIIPFIGEEIYIGSRVYRHGVIRFAADAQRAYNYARSSQTELIGLAPKAPFIGTEKNFKDYSKEWDTANTKLWPYLQYTPDPANGGQRPAREAPPPNSAGLTECIAMAEADMQAVIGIYNTSLGAKSNETSGIAIRQRERQGDTGTYVYMKNRATAIEQCARVINDLIPHYYDTARTIRILDIDNKSTMVKINQPQEAVLIDGVPVNVLNDVCSGSYDIQMEIGPSYNTKREEAREGMIAFIQAFPEAGPILAPAMAKLQDWPGADKVSKLLGTLAPPAVQAMIAEQDNEPPPPPQPPNPVQMAQAEAETAKAQATIQTSAADIQKKQLELTHQQLVNAKAEIDVLAARLALDQGGAPVDQAKLKQFMDETQAALTMFGEHLASGIEPAEPEEEKTAED